MNIKDRILIFSENRVWRTYPGGLVLDQLSGKVNPEDTHFPEDWIGSVTRARNPGREGIEEGISSVKAGDEGIRFDKLIASDPEYYLGEGHVKRFGPHPQLLVKLLDSSVRLHFQCHPTAEFAQENLNSHSGKAEAYHILAIREDVPDPYVYIGFQHPPKRSELKTWIENQDLEAIEGCFEKIPVKEGDTLFIPGGSPHAIGEGILMVEIMEPSDLAVRFEFEKAGYILPESARFMGKGLDFCLDVFNFSPLSLETIRSQYFLEADLCSHYPNHAGQQYSLIGPTTTPCMQIKKSYLRGPILKKESQFFIGIVTKGKAILKKQKDTRTVKPYDKFFFPAASADFWIEPESEVEILECYPPLP